MTLAFTACSVQAAEYFVSPSGSDSSGDGTIASPFATIQYVLTNIAQAGDTVTLRSGTYNEEVRVRMPDITLRSRADEWAVIAIPPTIDGDNAAVGVIFDVASKGSILQRVEITGGFYAVFFFSEWDWDDTPLDNDAAQNIVIEECVIHDTGRDGIKLPAGCDNITIRRCEIYNSGIGYPAGTPNDDKNAEGIDVVNCDNVLVQDCYIHDTATTGVYIKGGSQDGVIERTTVEKCGGLGISVGFDTSPEFFDLSANPNYYENIRGIVRNCVVVDTYYAGIALYGSKDAVIYNNTVVNTARAAHSPIYFGLTYQDWDDAAGRPANENPVIMNNIVLQTESIDSPFVSIRHSADLDGMSALIGNPTMNNNCYFKKDGDGFFEDNRPGSLLENGTLDQWRAHISDEALSLEVDPQLTADYQLSSNSPCIDKGSNTVSGMPSTDRDGNPRIAGGTVDMGAYEFSVSGGDDEDGSEASDDDGSEAGEGGDNTVGDSGGDTGGGGGCFLSSLF